MAGKPWRRWLAPVNAERLECARFTGAFSTWREGSTLSKAALKRPQSKRFLPFFPLDHIAT
jgi:hypothetical protein